VLEMKHLLPAGSHSTPDLALNLTLRLGNQVSDSLRAVGAKVDEVRGEHGYRNADLRRSLQPILFFSSAMARHASPVTANIPSATKSIQRCITRRILP